MLEGQTGGSCCRGGWLAKEMFIWMGRLEGPTGDGCCMGVGLFRGLGPVQIWGLGFWAYPHVAEDMFFMCSSNCKKNKFLITNLQANRLAKWAGYFLNF